MVGKKAHMDLFGNLKNRSYIYVNKTNKKWLKEEDPQKSK